MKEVKGELHLLIISKEEQRKHMIMSEVIDQAELALKEYSRGQTQTPIRTSLPFSKGKSTALFMPSTAEGLESIGLKFVNVVPENKEKGKKTINGIVVLSDYETGEPLALLEGSYLTMMRTGALSGVATKYLAREDASILGVIGTGEQAKGLCEAVLAVRKIEKILLYNRSKEKALAFAAYVQATYQLEAVVMEETHKLVEAAHILITATNASEPIFSTKLSPGTHVNAVGSFRPTMQELPSHVMAQADKIVVEAAEAALEETGDLIVPLEKGLITADSIHGEIGEIALGLKSGRESNSEITVFKSVGLAIVDIVVAKYVYEKVVTNKGGVYVSLD